MHSDRHCGGIRRDHVQAAGGGRPSCQINITETSKEITYFLQEGGQPTSQIDILQISKEITHVLQEGGEQGRTQQSDRHSADIKREITCGLQLDQHMILESADITRDHVLSVGAARTQQSDWHSADMTRDHARSAGGEGFSSQLDNLLQTSN